VSIGGIQSNQTRQVAAVAAHLGMKCVLVQENWVNYSDAVYDRVGNIEMSRILGADVRLDAAGFDIGIRPSWQQALDDVRRVGGKPFPIPAGCSEHPLGGLGFVGFAEEVRQQEAELGFSFDYIVVCSVTGSTQAGMVVGFAADGRAKRVIGVDASAKPAQTHAQILRIAQHTAEPRGSPRPSA
jgi:1-aminocyclopropane-1-carboxylate deaminase